jgi:acyl dehydratase
MVTMAIAARLVTDWAGDPGAVVEYSVRFTKPVVVPDDDIGAVLEVEASVAEKLDGNLVRLDLTARSAGEKVLGIARATVRLS